MNIQAGLNHDDLCAQRYADDARIGPVTRARCERHHMAAGEVYRGLFKVDAGTLDGRYFLQNIAD